MGYELERQGATKGISIKYSISNLRIFCYFHVILINPKIVKLLLMRLNQT